MEIDRRITNVWTITISEKDVFDRLIDEGIQQESRLSSAPTKRGYSAGKGILMSEDDKAILHRYYHSSLAELSALLARRTTRVGGSIVNNVDADTKMLTTVYTMPMTDNHESALLPALASHCLEFLVARQMEQWYGHGSDFGSNNQKGEIRHILHFRRIPIERPFSSIL